MAAPFCRVFSFRLIKGEAESAKSEKEEYVT